MTSNSQSSAAAVLKLHYEKKYEDVTFDKNPTLQLITKENNWGGTNRHVPVKFSLGSGGGSGDFVSGSNNTSPIEYDAWIVTSTKDYHFADVDGETYNASRISPDSFLDVSKDAISSALQDMANQCSINLFRDGTGVRGRIATSPALSSATTITLANPRDAKNFEIGMVLLASTASDGTGLKLTGRQITGINRSAGTLTFGSAVDGSGEAWAAGDYLYRHGDAASVLKGFASWIPESVASNDSFFSVNRSQDRERLAGVYYDGSSQQLAEALIDGLGTGCDLGASPDTVIVSSQTYSNLTKELGAQATQHNFSKGEIGFQYLVIHCPAGAVKIVADRSCPDGVAYALDTKTWKLCSRGPKTFNLDDRDGLMGRLDVASNSGAGADRLRYRFYTYIQLVCTKPSANIRIKLPTS